MSSKYLCGLAKIHKGHEDTHARDTGIKHPVVQRGDVDIEGEAKTKTESVRNGLPVEDRGSYKMRQDKR